MNSNFFNLQQNFAFEEAVFQCELGESLGLTRSCYLCSHYVLKSLTIDFDIACKNFSSKENKLELWCWKLLETIEEREGQYLEIFLHLVSLSHLCFLLSKPLYFKFKKRM